jgi:hypothetical protein
MDQRTRERLPALPVLAASVSEERAASAARLAAASAAGPGEDFTAGGQTLRRSVMSTKASARVWADEPGTGKRRDLTLEEHRGFWAWAAVEVLRATGMFSRGQIRHARLSRRSARSAAGRVGLSCATGVVHVRPRLVTSAASCG